MMLIEEVHVTNPPGWTEGQDVESLLEDCGIAFFQSPPPHTCTPPLQVLLTGPADPAGLSATGEITFEGGTLNLVATQFALDRCAGAVRLCVGWVEGCA